MASVDFREAYELVSHAWIIKTSKLIDAAPKVIALLKSTMINWKTELILGYVNRDVVIVKRGIFQGDSLSLLPFVISLISLTLVLRRMYKDLHFKRVRVS